MSIINDDKPKKPAVTAHEVNLPVNELENPEKSEVSENLENSKQLEQSGLSTDNGLSENNRGLSGEVVQTGEQENPEVSEKLKGSEQSKSGDLSGEKPQVDVYDESIRIMREWKRAHPLETEEDRVARERREKSKRIISAMSDGISAMSNLYFTSQYAPNAYTGENSQLKATDAVIDKIKAQRQKDADQYLNYSLKIGDLEAAKAKMLRDLEAAKAREKRAQDKADQEQWRFEQEQKDAPFKHKETEARAKKREQQANEAEQRAKKAKAEADAAPKTQALKQDTERKRAAKYGAEAGAAQARAKSYNKTVHHFRGKEYESVKDYTKDVTEAARAYNERHKDEVGFKPIEFERDERTAHGTKKVVRRPEDYAGEVERRLQEEDDRRAPHKRKAQDKKTNAMDTPWIR